MKPKTTCGHKTYRIVRFYQNQDIPSEVRITGLTLTEAQDWCKQDNTSSSTCKPELVGNQGEWFDGYEEE